MTRVFRAIPLSCVRFSLLSAVFSIALVAAPGTASAGIFDFLTHHSTDTSDADNNAPPADADADQSAPDESKPTVASMVPSIADIAPSVEIPLHHLYCVEYARARSGFSIFGDAKTWWTSAKNLYDEVAAPVTDAVMVFSGSSRIRRGHVAVVTSIVSPREIVVDQANWQNHGEIDHNTPVLDVSEDNDWSKVRVWDMGSHQFGAHVYAISGFIARPLPTETGS